MKPRLWISLAVMLPWPLLATLGSARSTSGDEFGFLSLLFFFGPTLCAAELSPHLPAAATQIWQAMPPTVATSLLILQGGLQWLAVWLVPRFAFPRLVRGRRQVRLIYSLQCVFSVTCCVAGWYWGTHFFVVPRFS